MILRRFIAALAIAAGTLAAPASFASTVGVVGTPTMQIFWRNGVDPNATDKLAGTVVFEVDDEGNFYSGTQTFTWGQGAEQDTITVNYAGGNFDPVITIGVGFVDFGTASIFNFVVSSPLVPTVTGIANYTLDMAGSFSNGSPNNGGSVGMGTGTFGIMDAVLNGTPFAGLENTTTFFPSGASSTYGPFASSGTVDCDALGGCTTFGLNLSALGSGGADAMSFTGRFEITQAVVPVPAAVWLFGPALGLLGFLRRRAS